MRRWILQSLFQHLYVKSVVSFAPAPPHPYSHKHDLRVLAGYSATDSATDRNPWSCVMNLASFSGFPCKCIMAWFLPGDTDCGWHQQDPQYVYHTECLGMRYRLKLLHVWHQGRESSTCIRKSLQAVLQLYPSATEHFAMLFTDCWICEYALAPPELPVWWWNVEYLLLCSN